MAAKEIVNNKGNKDKRSVLVILRSGPSFVVWFSSSAAGSELINKLRGKTVPCRECGHYRVRRNSMAACALIVSVPVIFQVLTAVSVKIGGFWGIALCSRPAFQWCVLPPSSGRSSLRRI
jgi:hypothetical protein